MTEMEDTLAPFETDLMVADPDQLPAKPAVAFATLTQNPLTRHAASTESQFFTAKIAINPLIAAASALFSVVTECHAQSSLPDFKSLSDTLSLEIIAFENKSHAQGYRTQVILAARYFLCALVDETVSQAVSQSHPEQKSEWQKHSLLKTFYRESGLGERFFVILRRSAEDPTIHVDLLELAYLCLSLGYQGQYRSQGNLSELGLIIDNLFRMIQKQRGHSTQHLLVGPEATQTDHKPRWYWPPVWVNTLVSLCCLGGFYLAYQQHLSHLSDHMIQMINQLSRLS